MDVAAADVIVGNHCFRLIVERQPSGGYRCQILDNDKHITGGGATGQTTFGREQSKESLEDAKARTEADLRTYVSRILRRASANELKIKWTSIHTGEAPLRPFKTASGMAVGTEQRKPPQSQVSLRVTDRQIPVSIFYVTSVMGLPWISQNSPKRMAPLVNVLCVAKEERRESPCGVRMAATRASSFERQVRRRNAGT